jgi:imidazolonepropionase-like amidohydrolase
MVAFVRHSSLAVLLAIGTPSSPPMAPGVHELPGSVTDTLRLYYVNYPVGYERYSVTTQASGTTIESDFDYIDRGRRTHLVSRVVTSARGGERLLEVARLTDSSRTVEARATVRGTRGSVVARGESTHVTLGPTAFPISGITPFSQHLALVRYWLANGRPATIAAIPGSPVNPVHIAQRGRDTLQVAGRRVILDRYAVEGVVWGTHSVWIDDSQRLAAITTAGGGGLSFDAVRLELEPFIGDLQSRAARDRIAELERLSRGVVPVARGTMAFVGANVIDGRGGPVIADATLLVTDGRVTAVGPRASIAIPKGTREVDVRGKTIIPGLWDMHGHLMQVDWGPAYLGAGVTTARDMGNVLPFVIPFRESVHSGRGLGPRMLLAGLIDGGGPNAFGAINATTPDEGRAAVRRYKELGFEQMKLYSLLTPEVVAAICDEAHRVGMTVTGHVPTALNPMSAVLAGMDQIAHQPIRGVAGSDSVRRMIAFFQAHGTVIDPTASWGELLQHSLDEPVRNFQPGVDQLPVALFHRIHRMGAAVDTATAHGRLAKTLRTLKALHDAGVPIVAGTDEGVPGFSVYREVELYVQAGIPPLEALKYATSVPARAMGLEGDVGTLEAGKRADLVVLDANPADNISNVRRVNFVMTRGTLYRSADIYKAAGFRQAPAASGRTARRAAFSMR